MRMRTTAVCLICAFRLLAATALPPSGALSGVIEDQSGAPIPGAKVKLTGKTAGDEFQATTDASGQFKFANLLPGEYVLSAQAPGVETAEKKVKVDALPAQPVHLRLEVTQVRQAVTVSATEASVPTAETNADSVAFGQDWLAGLPSKEADPLAVPSLLLNPAVEGSTGPTILVDGVETDALDLPTASIRHVHVNKNPYSAEFGRPGKGRIEVTTIRRIHNQYHGSVSTLFLNSALDARNAFATVRPLHQRVISEAEAEGPIRDNIRFLVSAHYDSNNDSSVIAAQTLNGPFVRNIVAPGRNTLLFGRLNFHLSAASKLSFTWKFRDKSRLNQGLTGFDLPERAINRLDRGNEGGLLLTSVSGAGLLNEFRATVRRRDRSSLGASDEPATLVLGAFNSGGAQVALHQRDTFSQFEDLVTVGRGKHTLRFGAGISPRSFSVQDASNFGGTFTFSSLAAFAQGTPFLFTQNLGTPGIAFDQHELYAFLQDEVRVRPNLSILPGVRYEWQSNGNSLTNFAPRLGLAYSPGSGATVLRAGFGVFYDRQPEIMEQQSLLQDGVRIRQMVISNPSFPTPLAPGVPSLTAIASVVRIDPGIRFPYLMQASVAVERRLASSQDYLSVEYSTLRGVNLYRTRNVNAPLPGTGLRPNPAFVNIDQFESSGTSRGNSLAVTLQTRGHKRLNWLAQYTLSRTTDDTGGLFSLPADNYDLRPERGRADFDQLHRFTFMGTYAAFWGFALGGTLHAASNIPFNITTGFDNNHDTVATDRPPGVHRNRGQGPGFAQADVRLSKLVRFERPTGLQLEMAADAFNITNHVNYLSYVGTLTSPFYRRANSAYPARELQLSVRLKF